MSKSQNLLNAKINKNDEFYTLFSDIEREILEHQDYIKHFENKIIYCNCDNPDISNFYKFFKKYFERLKIKKLIITYCNFDDSQSYKLECFKEGNVIKEIKIFLKGNGDFNSSECVELLKNADVIVTNPPFSLFRQYVNLLIKYQKKFLIIGNKNAIAYKDIFLLFQENKMWLGFTVPKDFFVPNGQLSGKMSGLTRWFTNLDISKRHKELLLKKSYETYKQNYPKYDNYNAIEVSKISDIPSDYQGYMGVPITFIDYFNPNQFEIYGPAMGWVSKNMSKNWKEKIDYKDIKSDCGTKGYAIVNGHQKYHRIIIKRKTNK